ncbi:hypothetical protein DRJ54_08260 [Candidatus Acetothermia bacterium]|nr:MAG: hypothetical protein DRJ54_08260 [Candidatus Acetothermia bacterium]
MRGEVYSSTETLRIFSAPFETAVGRRSMVLFKRGDEFRSERSRWLPGVAGWRNAGLSTSLFALALTAVSVVWIFATLIWLRVRRRRGAAYLGTAFSKLMAVWNR